MRFRFAVALLVFLCRALPALGGDTIDFESIPEGATLGKVTTPTNTVTFGVGSTAPTMTGFVGGVGLPQTAWNPGDTPNPATNAGARFLTDEARGPSVGYDYFMAFANPISSLALDLYDFRPDGGPSVGDTATLNLYSDDAYSMLVGQTIYTITGREVDENVVRLRVVLDCLKARTARIAFSHTDIGTGIDNVTFDTAGESKPGDRTDDRRGIGVDLFGRVGLDGKAPPAGFQMWIADTGRGIAFRPEIANDGSFVVPLIPAGRYGVEIKWENATVNDVRQAGRSVIAQGIVINGVDPPEFVEVEIGVSPKR